MVAFASVLGWSAIDSRAVADEMARAKVVGQGRLIAHGEAHRLLKHYRCIPGDGMKAEGRMITRDEAHKLLTHYKTIPGDGMKAVKGEARLITGHEAHALVKRYSCIPGDGMKAEGRMITRDEAHKLLTHYKSIPGDGMKTVKGEARLITRAEAHAVLERYRCIPGDGMKAEARLIRRGEAHKLLRHYGSIPGGLVLEGTATGIDGVKSVRYEPASNTFMLDDQRMVYASPVSAQSAALLARAIARDDRIGVSLNEQRHIVFGKVPASSDLAADLKSVDNFLGDMVLPPQEWTVGYKFANGFEPMREPGIGNAAVFFRFKEFEFALKEGKLALAGAQFDARIVPVLKKQMSNGGYLPDYEKISAATGYAPYEAGARHVAENISYYLGEDIVRRTLAYGEVAAFFRNLKASGINLEKLGRQIEASIDKPAAPSRTAPPTLEVHWLNYLREIQDNNHYANWSSPPYDLYLNRFSAGGTQ
jgi:hypothetical protein